MLKHPILRARRIEASVEGNRGASVNTDGPRRDRMDPHLKGGAGAALLRALAGGEHSVTELVDATRLSQPNVSNHLARLRERGLVTSRRVGRQMLYRLVNPTVGRLVVSYGVPAEPEVRVQDVAGEFQAALLTLREEDAAAVVERGLAAGLRWTDLYLDVFTPALEEVGGRWERGKLGVDAEHIITGIVLRLMHRLSLSLPVAPGPDAFKAVIGCVPGELHSLGGRMLADLLLAQGWRVWYLNGNLPAAHLLEAVERERPDAVVLCITLERNEPGLHRLVRRLLRWRGAEPLPLIVAGGQFFDRSQPPAGLDLCGNDVRRVAAELNERVAGSRPDSHEPAGT